MKVLIITYYWPPAGGSGVQRWLKFVKYLRDFDIEPVIYTVDNANYPIEDLSLIAEIPEGINVIKQPIKEPNGFLTKLKRNKKTSAGFLQKKPSILGKISLYIRANYFIPDARKFWIKPSVEYLTNYLEINPVDLIISTGPPHSLHLIAQALKSKLNIKWIADFRDPWTDIDYFHQLPLTQSAKQKHFNLEKEVLGNADHVTVVGDQMKHNYLKYNQNISVITNGYDDVDDQMTPVLDTNFSLVHIGMMNADRNPDALWKAIAELKKVDTSFADQLKIKLIGKVAKEVEESLARYGLTDNVLLIDYVSHQEALGYQRQAQVLLLIVNQVPSAKGIITGKIFEYLQAQRPILAIAPVDGDLSTIITRTQTGSIHDYMDGKGMMKMLKDLFENYNKGGIEIDSKRIDQYHRRVLTGELASIIKSVAP